MGKKYVYSKLAADTVFIKWVTNDKDGKLPKKAQKERILIKGGAGVVEAKALVTPLGVVTEVSEEIADFLSKNKNFLKQEKAGFLKISNEKVEIEKIAPDMARDKAEQETDTDLAAEGKEAKTNKDK